MSDTTLKSRRTFMIGGATATLFANAPPAQAALPLVGSFMANLVLGLSVRIGARGVAQTALNLGTSGLSLSLTRRIGASVGKLRKSNFTNFSKSRVSVTATGSLGFSTTVFPVISSDGYDCCAPFIADNKFGNEEDCDRAHCETMLEGPALYYLGEFASSETFKSTPPELIRSMIVPAFTVTDNYASMRAPRGAASLSQFATDSGSCNIITRVLDRRENENIMAGVIQLLDPHGNNRLTWSGPNVAIKLG